MHPRKGTAAWKAAGVALPGVPGVLLLLLTNTAGWPTMVGTRGASLKKIWPLLIVTGVASAGLVMLHTI